MEQRQDGGTVLGLILIVAGGLFLLAQVANIDVFHYGWPLFVLVPGVVLVVVGLASGGGPRAGLVVPGTILTTVGLVLLYQNATDRWETWAYAWALVGPTASGIGVALLGWVNQNDRQMRSGRNAAGVGLVLFAGFAAFFEGVLHISGTDFGPLGTVGFPFILIALGVVLLLGRLRAIA